MGLSTRNKENKVESSARSTSRTNDSARSRIEILIYLHVCICTRVQRNTTLFLYIFFLRMCHLDVYFIFKLLKKIFILTCFHSGYSPYSCLLLLLLIVVAELIVLTMCELTGTAWDMSLLWHP